MNDHSNHTHIFDSLKALLKVGRLKRHQRKNKFTKPGPSHRKARFSNVYFDEAYFSDNIPCLYGPEPLLVGTPNFQLKLAKK